MFETTLHMLSLTRDTKRLTFIVIYVFLFLGIGTGIYFLVRPNPTCFDGKRNQNEGGVDCGGICAKACMETATGAPLRIDEVAVLPTAEGKYDALARITNPNNTVGAKEFHYRLRLLDASEQEVAVTEGQSWALPLETKSLIAFQLTPTAQPTKATLEISDVTWARLVDYDTEPKIGVYQKAYTPSSQLGELGGVATGTIVNESGYDFRVVTVKIILRDAAGRALAVNQSKQDTFLVGDQRSFRLPWPTPFAGQVAEVQVEVDANVYDSDNFVKRYLAPSAGDVPVNSSGLLRRP